MSFSQARETYLDLYLQQKAGSLTPDDFQKEVSRLRVQDNNGSLWQLREDGAGWLKWDGQTWQGGMSPEEGPEGQNNVGPQTLGEFFTLLLKGAWAGGVRRWKVFAVLFVAAYAINVYLMMGYRIPWWGALSQFFATLLEARGNLVTRGVLWLFLPAALVALYQNIRREGPASFMKNFAGIPGLITRSIAETKEKILTVLLLSAAMAIFCCQVVESRLFSLGLALFFLISISYTDRSFLFLMARLSWSDYHRWRGFSPRAMERSSVFLAFAAMAAGSLSHYFFTFIHSNLGYYISVLLVIAAIALVFVKKKPARQREETSGSEGS
jgi:hypothetical protein